MPRVKRGVTAHKKHKRLLQLAEGFHGTRHHLFRPAHEAVLHSLSYAYRDRRNRRRDMRRLWITRINAAVQMQGMNYSRFMHGLLLAHIEVDRKMLAELAVHDQPAFAELVERAKAAIAQ